MSQMSFSDFKYAGKRKPYPLETMLRVHLLQNWFSLSDPAMEEALYEITSMRQFARLGVLRGDALLHDREKKYSGPA